MPLTREQILGADDLKTVEVEVPEWGGSVTLKQMDVTTLLEFEEARGERKGDSESAALMIAFSAVDEAGNRLFTPEDVEALTRKNPAAIGRLFKEALALSAVSQAAEATAVKNS